MDYIATARAGPVMRVTGERDRRRQEAGGTDGPLLVSNQHKGEAMNQRLKAWRMEPFSRIEITGVGAVLFAFFAVVASSLPGAQPYHGITTDLPRASQATEIAAARRDDVLIVTVQRDGNIYFQTDKTSPDALAARLRAGVAAGAPRKVLIKADANVRYVHVKRVLDGVAEASISEVSLLAATGARRPCPWN